MQGKKEYEKDEKPKKLKKKGQGNWFRNTLRGSKNSSSSVADFRSSDIAKVLTAYESELFKNIPLSEFISWVWGKTEKREEDCPNIYKLISRFDEVAFWVSTEVIISGNEQKRQKKVVQKYINIAKV